MPRRLLAMLCILGIAACQSDRTTAGPDLPPSFVVQDGANNSGNADFFFHPPLAPDPIGHPKFSVGQFNPALAPMVEVCRLNTSLPQNPTTASTCAGPVIPVAPVVLVAVNELYLAEWMAPAVNDAQFHRFFVRAGGKLLGSADVLLSHPKNLKGYKGPVPTAVPGQTVPVKFRIENRALCAEVEGTSPCASAAVDLSTGGNVTIPTVQGKPHSGVNVPGGNGSGKINVTVEPCAGGTLYHRGLVDIPMYGSCLTISAEPGTSLTEPALVYVCDVDLVSLSLNSEEQEKRVTLHRYDATTGKVKALPHAAACGAAPAASVGSLLKGAVRHLVRGEFRGAGRQLAQLVTPQPLHALDQGGGGLSDGFSDFQLGLPVKLVKELGDGQAGVVETTLPVDPTVKVTDLAGEPAAGARVRFAPDPGSGSIAPPDTVITGTDGLASVAWTMPGTAGAGLALKARGKGIGGDDPNNGPRPGVDPFMPFPYGGPPTPESGTASGAEELKDGSVTFTAEALESQCSGETCGEGVVNLEEGGSVTVSTGGTSPPSGVFIPPQGEGAPRVLVTVEPCTNQNVIDNLIDIPVFGSCLTVKTDPVLEGPLAEPATVFVCDAAPATQGLSAAQRERVSLHRHNGGDVYALPHADACAPVVTSAGSLLKGAFRHLVRGNLRAAGSNVLKLIGPRTLHALDQGGGGLSDGFSDFQFALPAAMHIVAGNLQTGAPGSELPVYPTVQVVDLGGEAVKNATVRFIGDGVSSTEVVTGVSGEAALPGWTIPNTGSNSLTASGRGIAGANLNGPRGGPTGTTNVDPFMAFPYTGPLPVPDGPPGTVQGAVELKTGTRVFTATGDPSIVLPYSSRGFSWKVVTPTGEPGFPADPGEGYQAGDAPFATHPTYDPCTIWTTYRPRTVVLGWLGTTLNPKDLLVRRTFTLSQAALVQVRVAIDNDVQVWLNGAPISGGLVTHEGCAVRSENDAVYMFTGVGNSGLNMLDVRARDRGVVGYFDIEVKLAPEG